jgi:DNA polymerase III subunit gamma/tau
MQSQSPSPARGSLPGPSRRITVEPVEVPVTAPKEEPATPTPAPEREPAPTREPVPTP